LDAGTFFSSQFTGEKIPLLEEVFEAVGKRTFINVELSNYNSPRNHLVETVCMLVKRFNLHKQILFSSFFASNLSQAQSYLPEAPCGLLALRGLMGAWARSFGFAFGNYAALHSNVADVTPQQVQRVHRLKKRVHIFTVNAEADMRRLFGWEVDGIITDDPRLAAQIRGEKK
jgi:glycerophosphoryl diester phosphodiesterase